MAWPTFSHLWSSLWSWDWFGGEGLSLSLTDLTSDSVQLNCSWAGEGGNVTWLVDSQLEETDLLQEDQIHFSVLDLYWDNINKTVGDTVIITCQRDAGSQNNENSVSWSSVSQSSLYIQVPGNKSLVEDNLQTFSSLANAA